MLSARKGIIRFAEAFCAIEIVMCIGTSSSVVGGFVSSAQVEPFAFVAILGTFGIFAYVLALASEFSKARGKAASETIGHVDISLRELKMLLRWCPSAIKGAYLLAAVVAVYAVHSVGISISWHSGEEFTERHALGFLLWDALVLLCVLPVLSSAARMPGTYAEHFHHRLGDGRDA